MGDSMIQSLVAAICAVAIVAMIVFCHKSFRNHDLWFVVGLVGLSHMLGRWHASNFPENIDGLVPVAGEEPYYIGFVALMWIVVLLLRKIEGDR